MGRAGGYPARGSAGPGQRRPPGRGARGGFPGARDAAAALPGPNTFVFGSGVGDLSAPLAFFLSSQESSSRPAPRARSLPGAGDRGEGAAGAGARSAARHRPSRQVPTRGELCRHPLLLLPSTGEKLRWREREAGEGEHRRKRNDLRSGPTGGLKSQESGGEERQRADARGERRSWGSRPCAAPTSLGKEGGRRRSQGAGTCCPSSRACLFCLCLPFPRS